MTPQQIQLIRQTFVLVEPRAELMALIFYQRLFRLDPSLRPLFRMNIEELGGKLLQTLRVTVALLDQPFVLVPTLEALGRRHAGYGVAERHYNTVGTALLDTLAECLGGAFSPEARESWTILYADVANAMQRGASLDGSSSDAGLAQPGSCHARDSRILPTQTTVP